MATDFYKIARANATAIKNARHRSPDELFQAMETCFIGAYANHSYYAQRHPQQRVEKDAARAEFERGWRKVLPKTPPR